MIIVKQDLLNLEKENSVVIKNRNDFGPFSLDLRVNRLFEDKKSKLDLNDQDIPDQEYIDTYLEEIPLSDTGIVLSDSNNYFWQPMEEMSFANDYSGRVFSRSSSARKGMCVTSDSSEYLKNLKTRNFCPLLSLSITGTEVNLRKGDSIAQLVIYDLSYSIVTPSEITQLIKRGNFEIKINNNKLKYSEVQEHNYINLHLGRKIWLYQGGVLDSKNSITKCFKEIDITKGIYIPEGSFFISSSAEHVEIPQRYIGMVAQMQTHHSHYHTHREIPFISHPNAPVIAPKNIFKGTITFENYMFVDGIIKEGMFLSQMYLEKLSNDALTVPSKYINQKGATLAK